MSAPAAVRACTCGHGEDVHTARRPEGACTACTQCDGLLREHPHRWRRCCCLEFEPAPRNAIEAEIAGELEFLEPHPTRGANSEADSTD